MLVLGMASCGGGSAPLPGCTPGQSMACTGPGGCAGAQICAVNGRGFAACLCSGGPELPVDAGTDGSVELPVDAAIDRSVDLAIEAPPAPPAPDAAADLLPDGRDAGLIADATVTDASPDLKGVDASSGALRVVPSQHDFGTLMVGATGDAFTFSVSNTGQMPLGGLVVYVNGAEFAAPAAGNGCATVPSLAPGATCVVDVVFRPATRGPKTGSLFVSAQGQTVSAAFSGNAASPAQLAVSPLSLSLTGQVAKDSAPVIIAFANVGEVSTGAITVALDGPNAADFKVASNGCLAPLAPSTACQVQVVLSAQSSGMKTATLTASSPVGGMAVGHLSGSVVTGDQLSITPNSASFGSVAAGQTSPPTDFEVRNTGGSPTPALRVMTTTAEFTITANTCGGSALAPGATCALSVVFRPSSPGSKAALLVVSGGDSSNVIGMLSGTSP
jgi:hypothetical protein